VHRPTCLIVNGPEYSFLGPETRFRDGSGQLPLAEIAGISSDLKRLSAGQGRKDASTIAEGIFQGLLRCLRRGISVLLQERLCVMLLRRRMPRNALTASKRR